jgi:hypothetical protein
LGVYQWGGTSTVLFEVQTPPLVGSYALLVSTRAAGVVRTTVFGFTVVALPPLASGVSPGPIPTLDKWRTTMLTLAQRWCNPGQVFAFGYEQDVWYYDGARVYFQIADYTGNKAAWEPCAYNIARQYRDYVLVNNGKIPDWRVFPHGLEMAYRRTGDDSYRQAVVLMAANGLYANRGGDVSDTLIRETAYIAQTFMAAERLGQARHPRLSKAIDYLLGHFDMYFVSGNFEMHQLFTDGLAAAALIEWYEMTKDPRIPQAIKVMLDWIWTKGWNGSRLVYNPEPAGPRCPYNCQAYYTSLINLTVPAFAWYWNVGKDLEIARRGDQIFSHSLDDDISYSGKIFSQNYRWSFDFVRWRQ